MLRTKVSQQAGAKRQKTRTTYFPSSAPCLTKGNCGFFFPHNFRFELVYLKLVRRCLRKAIKRTKRLYWSRRVWLSLKANYPISKKPKNARMGKGHGAFFR